ncbi:hypothetical protein DUI87_06681 [Hirundo rustica rustica]|uniref:c-SKI SMAD4-binding domain-containing protein n=1 Tax=Hirundo rustica rustica TaxID=333673 RepID=A0A3M0KY03_HIRRU|nr:hypothetical protein DUI87_06681 [Hirundo rustica rustica]
MYFSPNKFIFHSHRTPDAKYTQPDAANFNSWRRHLKLTDKSPQDELVFAWEDVKAMFNGGSRKRALPPAPPAPAAAAPAACHPLGSVKAAAVVGGGLLSPHLLAAPPDLHQKRPRFEEDEELQEAVAAAHGGKARGATPSSRAFRPVGGKEDSESLAKLHGGGGGGGPPRSASPLQLLLPPPPPPPPEDAGCERHPHPPHAAHRLLSPGGTSCSFASEESSEEEEDEEEEDEPEVDVEGHKPPEEEEEEEEEEGEEEPRGGDPLAAGGRFPSARGLPEKGGRERPAAGPFPRPPVEENPGDGQAAPQPPAGAPRAGSGGSSPAHHPAPEEQPLYKDNQKSKEGNQVILPTKEDTFSDKNKEHNFFITDSEPSGGDFWRDIAGEHTQETNSPHSLKKDVENMGKEELQKVLFEQIDLRRRLEQEFQVLKGNTSFPVFNNFQDQMKRELAYREEMVQQLQIGSDRKFRNDSPVLSIICALVWVVEQALGLLTGFLPGGINGDVFQECTQECAPVPDGYQDQTGVSL